MTRGGRRADLGSGGGGDGRGPEALADVCVGGDDLLKHVADGLMRALLLAPGVPLHPAEEVQALGGLHQLQRKERKVQSPGLCCLLL